jgi:hypothetical protein
MLLLLRMRRGRGRGRRRLLRRLLRVAGMGAEERWSGVVGLGSVNPRSELGLDSVDHIVELVRLWGLLFWRAGASVVALGNAGLRCKVELGPRYRGSAS